ncbi:MAG: metal-dependent transcriptional regulator [Actinobacteria bacterium]|nr:metal-dependent transcriptional regulator [Actinomycetota bacterium]
MSEGFHPPVEEYLEAIYELEEEGVPVIRARLAERLGHAAPTVTENVKRLEEKGYVNATGRAVRMSPQGRRLAESVTRKHRLAERLLTDVIGLEWHKIHAEAGRWEHVISDDVEEKLQELLGHPSTCPHGNPIPGAPAVKRAMRPLADLDAGTEVRLERVTERVEADLPSLLYLDEAGFRPGASAYIKAKAPDGTITVDIDGTTLAVGVALAGQLFVSAS